MEKSPSITPNVTRSRSRSRTRRRNSRSRSTSSTRRPLLANKKSLSATSLLTLTPSTGTGTASVGPAPEFDRTVPAIATTLDNTLPLDFFKLDLIGLIKALRIHKWHKHNLSASNLSINRISGALTNSIYKLEYKDEAENVFLPALLLRVYGRNVDSIIDRESELAILVKLLAKRIGPRLLGIFANGRFEQFLDGFNALDKAKIRDPVILQILGRRMKDLHYKIELDLKDFESTLPMSWKLIYKWLHLFETEYLQNYIKYKYDFQDLFLMDFDKFKNVIEKYKKWLFNHYDSKSFHQNYKFCHNDTQYGNLLLHSTFDVNKPETQKDSHLAVIDFEYSGANFPALDIANHFCEWMSDYYHPEKSYYIFDENFPKKEEQLNLISSYVEYEFRHPTTRLVNEIERPDNILEYETKKLYNECVFWRPTVSVYWFLWGMIQNGQYKPKNTTLSPANTNMPTSADDIGVDSTYNFISSQLESTHLDENVVVEDEITSSDDDFDYLKYSQQKLLLFFGDLIGLGVLEKEDVAEKYWDQIKHLDTEQFVL